MRPAHVEVIYRPIYDTRAITWKSFSTVSQVFLNSIEVVIGLPAQKQNRQPLPQHGKK